MSCRMTCEMTCEVSFQNMGFPSWKSPKAGTSPDNETVSVFCSYARVDHRVVEGLVASLQARNVAVWVDTADIPPATAWMSEIERAIDSSMSFMLLLSPSYVASPTCRAEATRARSSGKIIIPVVIEEVDELEDLSWLRAINWIDATSAADDPVIDLIARAATTNPQWAEQHRDLLLKAREWEQSGRRRTKLLRGRAIGVAERAMLDPRLPSDPQPVDVQRQYLAACRRSQRVTRWTFTALTTLASVISIGSAIVAVRQADHARHLQSTAEARLLAAAAVDEADPAISALLAAEAVYRTDTPTTEAVEALITSARLLASSPLTTEARFDLESAPSDISLAPDGRHLALRTGEGDWEITDLTGEPVGVSFKSDGSPLWRPDGSALAADTPSGLRVIGVDGSLLVTEEADADPRSWSPDGRLLLTARPRVDDFSGEFPIIDVSAGGRVTKVVEILVGFGVPTFSWDPSGRYVAVTDMELLGDSLRRFVLMIDLEQERVAEIYYPYDVEVTAATAIVCCHIGDDPLLVIGTTSGELFNIGASEWWSGSETAPAYGFLTGFESSTVEVIEVSPDGLKVASGGADGGITLTSRYDSPILAVPGAGRSEVSAIAWDETSQRFVAARTDGSLVVVDQNGTQLGAPVGSSPNRPVNDIVLSGDGRVVTVTADNDIVVYRLEAPNETIDLGATTVVSAAAWNPTGQFLAVGTASGVIELLDQIGRSTGVTYRADELGLLNSPVLSLDWSPNGEYIAVTLENGGLAMVESGQRRWQTVFQYSWQGPTDVSWSSDSTFVVVAGPDGLATRFYVDGSSAPVDPEAYDAWLDSGEQGDVSGAWATSDDHVVTLSFDGVVTLISADGRQRRTTSVEPYSRGVGGTNAPVAVIETNQITLLGAGLDSVVLTDDSEDRWTTARWSPTGDRLAVTDLVGEIVIFDATGREEFTFVSDRSANIAGFSWAATGDALLVWFDNAEALHVSATENGDIRSIRLRNRPAEWMAWSPSGQEILSVSKSGSIWIERLPAPQQICRFVRALVDLEPFRERLRSITTEESCDAPDSLAPIDLW